MPEERLLGASGFSDEQWDRATSTWLPTDMRFVYRARGMSLGIRLGLARELEATLDSLQTEVASNFSKFLQGIYSLPDTDLDHAIASYWRQHPEAAMSR